MSHDKALKSILKPSPSSSLIATTIDSLSERQSQGTPAPGLSSISTSSRKETHHRALALHHARIIDARRQTEDLIFRSLETLLSFPHSPTGTASSPTASDVRAFTTHLRPFRPRDYDDLIVERNLDGKCGYVLCGRRRRRDHSVPDGAKRIVGQGRDVRVVKKEDLERWCVEDGDACKRRALWVRLQLSETPAWEREGSGEEVELWSHREGEGEGEGEGEKDGGAELGWRKCVAGVDKLDRGRGSDSVRGKTQGETALALERGDTGFTATDGLVHVKIKEKATASADPPSVDHELGDRLEMMHLALDGYIPSFGRESKGH